MLHSNTRDYARTLMQARLVELTHRLGTLGPDDAAAISDTASEIRDLANYLADLMTHHLDIPAPAPVEVEPPREMRAALHLYKNVLNSYDAIREMEVTLGLSDKANSRPHNLMRDIRKFVDAERKWTEDASPIDMNMLTQVLKNGVAYAS